MILFQTVCSDEIKEFLEAKGWVFKDKSGVLHKKGEVWVNDDFGYTILTTIIQQQDYREWQMQDDLKAFVKSRGKS